MSVDVTGRIVILVRDDAAVAAITPRVRGGEKSPGDVPPFVVVRRMGSVPWISDPGTETAGVNSLDYVALCYAQKSPDGERLAFVLAGAVSDAVNDHGMFTFALTSGRAVVHRVQVDSVGAGLRDPATGEPFVPVFFSVYAGSGAYS